MNERDRMDRRLAADLEAVLTAQIEHDAAVGAARSAAPAHDRRSVWVTAVVGAVVAVLTIVAIQAAAGRPDVGLPAATASSSTARLAPTLLSDLPKPRGGTVVHTWTDQRPGGSGPFDVAGSTVVIAAVCQGGGVITIHDAAGKPHRWRCTHRVIQQPFWRGGSGDGDEGPDVETGSVRASVTVESGRPQFVVRMWKVDPRLLRGTARIGVTSATVPASLRTCRRGDLAATGTLTAVRGENSGVVTITNRGSSDCAIRSWPAMTYLDRSGAAVGPTRGGTDINGRSIDSREGAVDRFQEFPPARLAAGGHGYLIVDLYTRDRLDSDDRDLRAAARRASASPSPSPSEPSRPVIPVMPPPLCRPVTIGALRLVISGSTVVVPAPTSPARATCAESTIVFGVNPVVTKNPVDG